MKKTLALLLAVVMVVFMLLFRIVIVSCSSMYSTLWNGDWLLVTGSMFRQELRYGDIIVASKDSFRDGECIIKRVIATEGQTIDIDFVTWTVTVDGKVVDEPYRKLASDGYITSDWSYPLQVPAGHVFVMGDNRNHSADSRCHDIGLIDERCIVGKALVRIFPLDRITVFD
mgnify:CR=1 FL=1